MSGARFDARFVLCPSDSAAAHNPRVDHDDSEAAEPVVPDPARIAEQAREKLGEPQPDLEERLAAIEARARRGQAHFREAMPSPDENRPDRMSGEESRGLGVGLTVAYAILGVPLAMYALGYALDMATQRTQVWRSSLGLLGCFMGVGYAVYIANRAGKR